MNAHQIALQTAQSFYLISTVVTLAIAALVTLIAVVKNS